MNRSLRSTVKDKTMKPLKKKVFTQKRKMLDEEPAEVHIPCKTIKVTSKHNVKLKTKKNSKNKKKQCIPYMNKLTTISCTSEIANKFIHRFLHPVEVQSYDEDEFDEIDTQIEDFVDVIGLIANDFKENAKFIEPVFYDLGLKENIVDNTNKNVLDYNHADDTEIEEIPHNSTISISNDELCNEGNSEIVNDLVNCTLTNVDDENVYIETGRYFIETFADGIALILEAHASIHMYGLIEISVLHGSIDILGKKLDKLSRTVKAYSPRGSAFLSIRNLDLEEDINKKHLTSQLHAAGLSYTQANECVRDKLNSKMAVLICKKLIDKQILYLKENVSQNIYPYEDTLNCLFRNFLSNEWNVLNINADWDNVVKTMSKDSRVMLCGGKGVGKSTAMRFMVNRLLDRFEAVLVIDLDPGQPEFTISGCISSSIIKNPLLGPSYTHLARPEKSILVPNIDVNNDFVNYLLCVKELLKISTNMRNMPTIINFMGFTRGIGINITASAVAEVLPTMVIQIDNLKNQSQNYVENLTCENVKKLKTLLTPNNSKDVNYEFRTIASTSKILKWELTPKEFREMNILSYIGQMLPQHCDYLTEKDVTIFKIALSDIKIINNGKECSPMAINANIVSLCSMHKNVDVPIFNCHGWGIVRGISEELNFLNLLTPLSIDELECVDYLVLGSTTLPPCVYFRKNNKVKGLVPYVYHGTVGEFARTPKRSIKYKN